MKTHTFNRKHIIKRFGQWAVTRFGVENLDGPCRYDICVAALAHAWWKDHMAEKNWVHADEFAAALDFAREHFGITVGGDVLW